MSERRTLQQQVAAAEAKTAKLREALRKKERSEDAHRKIIIAVAVIAETMADPDFAGRIRGILRKRVTRKHDLDVLSEWLSTT